MLAWFTLILTCQLAGELAVTASAAPFPGPVLGVVLLLVVLAATERIPDDLGRVGEALLSNLSQLFVPAGVGVMAHFALLSHDWPAQWVAVTGSTSLTVAVAASAMVRLKRLAGEGNDGEGGDA